MDAARAPAKPAPAPGVSIARVGRGQHPVIIVDRFSGQVPAIVGIAAAMAPFEAIGDTYYPGLRRHFTRQDAAACAYADRVVERVVPLIAQVFARPRLGCREASFSIVTAAPDRLQAGQRVPHFDSIDPGYFAVLHYLSETAGTAFYRQAATGIEQVTAANREAYLGAAEAAMAGAAGYIQGSTAHYEQIGAVDGRADRVVIYQGALLHSGIIPPGTPLDPDPRRGRLTANFFLQASG